MYASESIISDSFGIHSRFLYQLYETDGLPPLHNSSNTLKWLHQLSEEAGIELRFSIGLVKRIYKQCSKVAINVKRLKKNGRQKECYLNKDWKMTITPSDVKVKRVPTTEVIYLVIID